MLVTEHASDASRLLLFAYPIPRTLIHRQRLLLILLIVQVLGVSSITSLAANVQSLNAAWFTAPSGTQRPPSRAPRPRRHLPLLPFDLHPRHKYVPAQRKIHPSSGRRFHFLTSVHSQRKPGPPFPRMTGPTVLGEAKPSTPCCSTEIVSKPS